MERAEFLAGVAELYEGEVIGEGLFSRMLAACADEHRVAMASLLQLESEAKVRLRPFLTRLGLSVVEDETKRAAGAEFASRLNAMSWPEAMRALAELSKPYFDRYRALEEAAPEADKAEVAFMVRHEGAVVRFAELEAVGRRGEALESVTRLLERPVF